MLRTTLIILISMVLAVSGLYAAQEEPELDEYIGKPVEEVLIDLANLPEELAIERWYIKLSGYSDNTFSRRNSSLKIVDVDFNKIGKENQEEYTAQLNKSDFNRALGIRVYFEYSHANDWAQIKPRLPIDPYYASSNIGIIRNVGPIKSISMWVSGRNYKNTIEVRMTDQKGQYKSINFGSLYYRGWRKKTWVNHNYIKDLRKRDIIKEHLYPQFLPYLKFDSLVVYKSPQESGGDFVTYVKDIRVEYEPAVLDYEKAIADENEWGILETKAREIKEKQDKFYDIYFSGSTKEKQYMEDKAKRDAAAADKTK